MTITTVSNGNFGSATPAARVGSGNEFGPRLPDETLADGKPADADCAGVEVAEAVAAPVGVAAGAALCAGLAVGEAPEPCAGFGELPIVAPPPLQAASPSVDAVAECLMKRRRERRTKNSQWKGSGHGAQQ